MDKRRDRAALAVGALLFLAACARVAEEVAPVQGNTEMWEECCFERIPYSPPAGEQGDAEGQWTLPIDPPMEYFLRPWARLGRTEASG